jgi:hypothetical protein
VRRAALVLVALTLTGCETTAEKSAKLERAAEAHARPARHALQGLSIAHESADVKVIGSGVVHSSEGSAAFVMLRNLSSRPLKDVPIAITVNDPAGATTYANNSPGLAPTLVSAALLGAHGEMTWVDDQVQSTAAAGSLSVKVGEASAVTGPIPRLSVNGAHLSEDVTSGAGVEGTVTNHSQVEQQELAIYAVARKGARIVAAGRAVLPQLPTGATLPFQVFFIGDPRGARLTLSAPPSTLG